VLPSPESRSCRDQCREPSQGSSPTSVLRQQPTRRKKRLRLKTTRTGKRQGTEANAGRCRVLLQSVGVHPHARTHSRRERESSCVLSGVACPSFFLVALWARRVWLDRMGFPDHHAPSARKKGRMACGGSGGAGRLLSLHAFSSSETSRMDGWGKNFESLKGTGTLVYSLSSDLWPIRSFVAETAERRETGCSDSDVSALQKARCCSTETVGEGDYGGDGGRVSPDNINCEAPGEENINSRIKDEICHRRAYESKKRKKERTLLRRKLQNTSDSCQCRPRLRRARPGLLLNPRVCGQAGRACSRKGTEGGSEGAREGGKGRARGGGEGRVIGEQRGRAYDLGCRTCRSWRACFARTRNGQWAMGKAPPDR
jgi:hypothetical protein